MDAAEIAEVREHVERCKFNVVISKLQLLALLDALEQAQNINEFGFRALVLVEAERDAAQQDAKDARALLVETQELCESVRMLPLPVGAHAEALRARIEAMLEQKP